MATFKGMQERLAHEYEQAWADGRLDDSMGGKLRKCEPWCGLPAPHNAMRECHWRVESGDAFAYCTAACLERAKSKRHPLDDGPVFSNLAPSARDASVYAPLANKPGKPESPAKREPVHPWTRSKGGQNCTTGFNWTTRQWDDESHYSGTNALYSRPAPNGGPGNEAACEACAERAGVFGPVVEAAQEIIWIPPQHHEDIDHRSFAPYAKLPPGMHAPGLLDPPTCAGPLATHGTPVLRVMKRAFRREAIEVLLCDACFLDNERVFAVLTKDHEALVSLGEHDGRSTDPPARIGEVPQVLGPMRGIWASRGMR